MLNTDRFRRLQFEETLKTKIILGAIAVMVVTTSAVFAVVIFTQTFPPITRPAPAITANCTTLSVEGAIPAVGTSGFIRFNCGAGVAAFSAPAGARATPTFTLPAGYTNLQIVGATQLSCPGNNLLSGTSFSFALAGDFDYCSALDSNTAVLATFDITWNTVS